jgi:hypothetical protein
MSINTKKNVYRLLPCVVVAGLIILASGCQEESPPPAAGATPTTQAAAGHGQKGGAELWSQWCVRCHNLRPPTEFSNAQWQVIVHHMRVRGNLTGEEQEKILAFLKSANM